MTEEITYRIYWDEVKSIARSIREEYEGEEAQDEGGTDAREHAANPHRASPVPRSRSGAVMSQVEARLNPDGRTWCLTVRRPGRPDLVYREAPWDLVERTTQRCERESFEAPGNIANAISWIIMLLVLPGPLFWLIVEFMRR